MKLVDRDIEIMRELERWRFLLSRHIGAFAGFRNRSKAINRRIRKLLNEGFIERRNILYGVPPLYVVATKGKKIIDAPARKQSIKIEQIRHDIFVRDTALFFHQFGIPFSEIITEKELYQAEGFGVRKHQPDFVISHKGKQVCIEVEISLKAKKRMLKNIQNNFNAYDRQIWIIPKEEKRIERILIGAQKRYTGIQLKYTEEITKYVSENY